MRYKILIILSMSVHAMHLQARPSIGDVVYVQSIGLGMLYFAQRAVQWVGNLEKIHTIALQDQLLNNRCRFSVNTTQSIIKFLREERLSQGTRIATRVAGTCCLLYGAKLFWDRRRADSKKKKRARVPKDTAVHIALTTKN